MSLLGGFVCFAEYRSAIRACQLVLSLMRYNPALMSARKIELKGLSPDQIDRLLPEGLISLCWRGSVAHGMYVPKSDPDSIDDKDVMGVYVGPLEHYLGFGRRDVYEQWEGEWDCVFYELRKFIGLLLNCNPNVLSLLWIKPSGIIYENALGGFCASGTVVRGDDLGVSHAGVVERLCTKPLTGVSG